MTDTEVKIPVAFTKKDWENATVDKWGNFQTMVKTIQGVKVTYERNSGVGSFISFQGLKATKYLCLQVDADSMDIAIHHILEANNAF